MCFKWDARARRALHEIRHEIHNILELISAEKLDQKEEKVELSKRKRSMKYSNI